MFATAIHAISPFQASPPGIFVQKTLARTIDLRNDARGNTRHRGRILTKPPLRRYRLTVAPVSQPAGSPISNRLAVRSSAVCGLETRDTADWKSALRWFQQDAPRHRWGEFFDFPATNLVQAKKKPPQFSHEHYRIRIPFGPEKKRPEVCSGRWFDWSVSRLTQAHGSNTRKYKAAPVGVTVCEGGLAPVTVVQTASAPTLPDCCNVPAS